MRAASRDTDSAGTTVARAAGSFAILATGAILFLPCMLLTSIMVVWATLVVNCSTYALIVSEAQRGVIAPNMSGYQSAHGIRFRLGASQPVQIAFPIDGDMESEWGAIIYDPTNAGDAVRAVGPGGRHAVPDSIAATFGWGRCSPMIARYYRCTFQ